MYVYDTIFGNLPPKHIDDYPPLSMIRISVCRQTGNREIVCD